MNNITFVVFTYNEASRLERVIKNFQNYGKILVADNKSTDDTLKIARSYGCEILIREQNYDYVENQHLVDLIYQKIKTDWIYWSFADEMLEEKTLKKLITIIASEDYDIINMDRKNYNNGKFCHNLFHGYTHKAFRKLTIDFSENSIHGMGKPTVPKERIYTMPNEFFIHHFSSYTVSSYLNTINKYTDSELRAGDKASESLTRVIWQITKRILKNYFFDRGYKAGFTGLESVLMILCYEWVKNIKLYEMNNNLNRETIERDNDKFRDMILNNFNK